MESGYLDPKRKEIKALLDSPCKFSEDYTNQDFQKILDYEKKDCDKPLFTNLAKYIQHLSANHQNAPNQLDELIAAFAWVHMLVFREPKECMELVQKLAKNECPAKQDLVKIIGMLRQKRQEFIEMSVKERAQAESSESLEKDILRKRANNLFDHIVNKAPLESPSDDIPKPVLNLLIETVTSMLKCEDSEKLQKEGDALRCIEEMISPYIRITEKDYKASKNRADATVHNDITFSNLLLKSIITLQTIGKIMGYDLSAGTRNPGE